jgi:hypothetical protein
MLHLTDLEVMAHWIWLYWLISWWCCVSHNLSWLILLNNLTNNNYNLVQVILVCNAMSYTWVLSHRLLSKICHLLHCKPINENAECHCSWTIEKKKTVWKGICYWAYYLKYIWDSLYEIFNTTLTTRLKFQLKHFYWSLQCFYLKIHSFMHIQKSWKTII